ncbi:MAG: TM1812 family CRISPR-associated protein [Oscillospiraceae bacterium]|nr:TM1812 family CRISPR-associated protein [Oscillospiraceae bacterium]
MYVIITNLSSMRPGAQEFIYRSDLGDIRGTHTSDAPVTYLLTMLAKQGNAADIRVIAVTAKIAETAFPTFSEMLHCSSENLGIPCPEIRKVSISHLATTVREIVTLIPKDSHVYIDTTGGFRDSSYLLMAVVRILEYSGIRLEKAVYSRYEQDYKGIEDVTANYRLFDLISASNSFTEFGNSRDLFAFFKERGCPEVQRVLAAMNAFSETVAMCRTSGLEEILEELNQSLLALDTMQTDDENEILFQSISGVIRQKFGISADGSTKAEYPAVINWCLEHQFIQQAVTIYTEKIATHLFRLGILSTDDTNAQGLEEHMNNFDLYYRLFYEGFMAMPVSYATGQTPFGRFIRSIKEDEEAKAVLARSSSAAQAIQKMPSLRSKIGKAEEQGINRLLYVKQAIFGKGEIRRPPEAIAKNLQKSPELLAVLPQFAGNNPVKLINQIITNEKLHIILQGEYENPVHVYDNHHINTIEYLKDALKEQTHFQLHTSIPEMQTIMRDYLYVKNFLRNSFNHASDGNCRTAEEIQYFREHGYPTKEIADLEEVVAVMRLAVAHCEETKLK